MLSFEEVENCFPDGGLSGSDGISVSAQWLHNFAQAVAAQERESCAKACEAVDSFDYDDPNATFAVAIRKRSNV
jgi:hypothetical protein